MRVVFLKDVEGVALGGDVKEVKNGFARNYLIPKQLAMPASHNSLKRVERLSQLAESERLKHLADMKALAEELNGKRVDVEMRAGATGRLYGSVNAAVLTAELSTITDRDIDRRVVQLPEPIREVGVYDVSLQLHTDVDVVIQVVVYPDGADPEETIAAAEGAKAEAEAAAEAEAEAAAAVRAGVEDETEVVGDDAAAEAESATDAKADSTDEGQDEAAEASPAGDSDQAQDEASKEDMPEADAEAEDADDSGDESDAASESGEASTDQ